MRAKTGVWLIGACGNVGTMTIVGARAIARGLAGRTGLVSELKELRALPLPPVENLVFGGHETSGTTLLEAARLYGRRAGVLTDRILDPLADELDRIQASIKPGHPSRPVRSLGGKPRAPEGPKASVEAIQADLEEFKRRHGLAEVVVVNVATTEPRPETCPEWENVADLCQALDDDRADVFPTSLLYAYAALDAGHPYVNFTPSTGSSVPALDELARARGTVHAGRDGKTGETLVKTTLAPLFAYRNLKVHAWESYNMLGNPDGAALRDPRTRDAKTTSKDRSLRAILGETGEQIRALSRPASAEAYDRYMRGLLFINKRDKESLDRAQTLFEETIKIDPKFGPTYLQLAMTHLLLSDYSPGRRREVFEQAIGVATRGVEADPSIREPAQLIHGFVHHQYGDWTDAAAAYKAAFRGMTVYPTTYQWHSRLLSALGLLEQSLQQAIAARAMEPASQVLNSRVANAYLWINDMAQARHFFEEANRMGPGAPIHHFGYTMFLMRDGRLEEARASTRIAVDLLQGNDFWVDPIFNSLANPEDPDLRNIAFGATEQLVANNTPPYVTMIIWALLGQADRVMEVAMNLAESGKLYEHESAQVEIIYLDELKPLREHEEFPALLRKLGLTDYWTSIGCQWSDDQVLCEAS